MASLHPAPGYVLVELQNQYSNIPMSEGKYNRHTNGVCVEVCMLKILVDEDNPYYSWIDNRIFWEELQASEIIEQEGKKYCFIKLEDIRGYEVSQETD